MRQPALPFLSIIFCLACPSSIWAQNTDEPAAISTPQKAEVKAAPVEEKYDHRFQFGLGLRSGTGFRAIVPYHEENCGELKADGTNKDVCSSRQPVWLEISPSFGLTEGLELLVDLRLSLEEDFSKSRPLYFAPGVKYYPDAEEMFKFFIAGQMVFEIAEQDAAKNPDLTNFDMAMRAVLGVQLDVLRYLGFYLQGGTMLGFNRWLTVTADFAAGVQGRY